MISIEEFSEFIGVISVFAAPLVIGMCVIGMLFGNEPIKEIHVERGNDNTLEIDHLKLEPILVEEFSKIEEDAAKGDWPTAKIQWNSEKQAYDTIK